LDQSVNAGVATSTEDVTPESSTGTPDVTVSSTAAASADRTHEQMFRELQRKQAEQSEQIQQALGYIATLVAAKTPQQNPAPNREMTDEELWTAAQNGDRDAFVLHQQRITDRRIAQQNQTQGRANIVDGQLRALFARYPVLSDPSHQLTKIVNQAYGLYVQNGYPQGKETMLEAAKTAIADSPELIAELLGTQPNREVARQDGVRRAQSGVTGVTHGRTPTAAGQKKLTISPEEVALAKRMGVKDPLKAKENFLKRNAEGTSSLGAVSAFVNPEDF
jgi:hypothetical protein